MIHKNTARVVAAFWLLLFVVTSISVSEAQTKKKSSTKTRYYSIPVGEKVRVRMDDTISSKSARVGDTFKTKTVEPVYSSNGIQVIPIGSVIEGRVIAAEPAHNEGKPGSIDVAFTAIRLPNGRRVTINGSLASFEEDGTHGDEEGRVAADKTSNRKVKFIGGGAGGGALIGGLSGGGKGALIGGAIGAGAGLLGDRFTKGKEAEVKEGTEFGVYLNKAISLPAYRTP